MLLLVVVVIVVIVVLLVDLGTRVLVRVFLASNNVRA